MYNYYENVKSECYEIVRKGFLYYSEAKDKEELIDSIIMEIVLTNKDNVINKRQILDVNTVKNYVTENLRLLYEMALEYNEGNYILFHLSEGNWYNLDTDLRKYVLNDVITSLVNERKRNA